MKLGIRFLLLFILVGCAEISEENRIESTANTQNKYDTLIEAPVFHSSHEPKKLNAPFSDVVQVGNTYYLSGQIGMNHSSRTLVAGGIKTETTQALENIQAVLAQHNLDMTDVIKATVILDDIEDFAAFNEVYSAYFPQKPARTTFAAEALARGAKIEIEVVAIKSSL